MTLTLQAMIEARGPAAAIVLTDDQVATLGAGKAGPVTVTIAGTTARLRLARMDGENLIGTSKAVRAQLSVQVGDQVEAEIAPDRAERTVDVPPELTAALDEAGRAHRLRARVRRPRKGAARTGAH